MESLSVYTAYEVYNIDQGLVWCGVNNVGFTTPENAADECKMFRGEGVQMEMKI
jgi:hypothetical protein